MDHVIDARGRLPSAARNSRKEADPEALRIRRAQRRSSEAASLRAYLGETGRLAVEDRKILVRNLGRAIERKAPETAIQSAARLFRLVYGEEGGASHEKKRKRYIRFDGEPMGDHGAGNEYAANGREFLQLAEGVARLHDGDQVSEAARDHALLLMCEGASFASSRPSIQEDIGAFENVRQVMDALIDRITRETDLLAYLEEMPAYAVRVHPQEASEFTYWSLTDLHQRLPMAEAFEHAPAELDGTVSSRYRRLRLDGFDTNGILVPYLRLARVYVPRRMLCLPASVDTRVLEELRTRPLSAPEHAEAMQGRAALLEMGLSPDKAKEVAVGDWRREQEYTLWQTALKAAGLDPDRIDWLSFEDPEDSSALHGAEWRTFWQSMTLDLVLVADGQPEALQWGLAVSDPILVETLDRQRDLLRPSDDDLPDRSIRNCIVLDEDDNLYPWFPVGDRSYACRGFHHIYSARSVACMEEWQSNGWYQFAEPLPDELGGFHEKPIWPLQSEKAWALLTLPMTDWQAPLFTHREQVVRPPDTPSLRPLFDAPRRWTPAPDGTLAAALLSGMAYGEGAERLDEKIIAEVNALVRCFRDMKQDLASDFDAALAARRYQPGT